MNIVFNGPAPTLRDWLAVMALPAIYQNQCALTDRAAELAYEQADELLKARSAAPEEGKSDSYRNALSHAAYALFQIKRMAGVPQHVIDFVRSEHAKACAVLDGDVDEGTHMNKEG
jgi:hypothetical protein